MNMFANLPQEDIQDSEKDVLGGGYKVPDSGLYDATVKVAYVTQAATGARAVNVVLTLSDGTEVREALWVQSGNAKGNLNYYVNSKGEKKFLPGYLTANTLCELASGKDLRSVTIEEKVLNLYSPEAGKEVPTKVPVIMDVLNKPIKVGLVKVIENKNIKDATGTYVPTAETREFVEINKVFYADGLTKTEKEAGNTEPAFAAKWAEKWTGEVKDRREIKDGQTPKMAAPVAGVTGGGFQPNTQQQQPAQAAPAINSLFG